MRFVFGIASGLALGFMMLAGDHLYNNRKIRAEDEKRRSDYDRLVLEGKMKMHRQKLDDGEEITFWTEIKKEESGREG